MIVPRFVPGGAAAVAIAAALTAAPRAQADRRPMTIEDLLVGVRIADPQVSPDSRTVVFVRTTTELASGRRNADLWSVPADGGAAKELIGGEKAENTPRWSPNGRKLAFISTRDGAAQVYLADADGGSVQKVTDLAMGVQPPLILSPDGTKVAFVSDVYPECTDEACNKRRKEEIEKNPVKVRRLTRLLYRHWDEWRENVRHHVMVADLESKRVVDLTPGDFDSPPGQQEDAAIAFSPDSRDIAFVSNRDGNDREAWSTNNDVWLVPVSGGTAKKLTPGTGGDVQPVFSADGRTILVRAQRRGGFESDRWYLDAYDRTSGQKRTIFETPDLSVGDFALSKDGASIWFTAGDQAREHLYVVPASGGAPKRVAEGGAISAPRPGDGFVVFSKSSLTAPPDIFRVATAGGHEKALTTENGRMAREVAFTPPESRSVRSAAGATVQYWLLKPPNFDASRKYPVVFLIHGGPQGAWEDAWSTRWNPSLWAAQGWVVAAPNPRGSTGFGQKFVDEISNDWGGKAMTDIDAVVNEVAKLPFTDSTRMGIAGASYGATQSTGSSGTRTASRRR
jgi:dipeptidyl aminopeptidase/acylaminoacyl peptidase